MTFGRVWYIFLKSEFEVCSRYVAHGSQIEDVVPLTDGFSRCILGSIFVHIGLQSAIRLLPITKWFHFHFTKLTLLPIRRKIEIGTADIIVSV